MSKDLENADSHDDLTSTTSTSHSFMSANDDMVSAKESPEHESKLEQEEQPNKLDEESLPKTDVIENYGDKTPIVLQEPTMPIFSDSKSNGTIEEFDTNPSTNKSIPDTVVQPTKLTEIELNETVNVPQLVSETITEPQSLNETITEPQVVKDTTTELQLANDGPNINRKEKNEHKINQKTYEKHLITKIKTTEDININDMESIDSTVELAATEEKSDLEGINKQETVAEASTIQSLKKWFSFNKKSDVFNASDFDNTMKLLKEPQFYNLAYSRYQENNDDLNSKSTKDKESLNTGADSLRKTFNEIKIGVEQTNNDELLKGIDWEFWSDVVNCYSEVVKDKQDEFMKNITDGIPRELRGMIWQLICNSKSMQTEEFFRTTKNQKSNYEKLIKRDLARTSFVTNSSVKKNVDDLFLIIKTYSLYDTEVGYTQGMAFITVPLLMNMDASEAFCMLVKLMFTYGFRDFYLPEMPGLHLKLYQFDRLIEDNLPDLYLHLKRQGIKSTMYATQWFLTLFGYKFPLDMVLRIYDIVIAEGIESILKFALNLMVKNTDHLLTLPFDQLLGFLKDKIFFYYLIDSSSPNLHNHFNMETYKLDQFVKDSMSLTILPMNLNKYRAEFDEIDRLEREREKQIEDLRIRNGKLTREIREIEAAYATLNKEHVEIANEMVHGKVTIANLQDDNENLEQRIKEITKRLENLQNQTDLKVDFSGKISDSIEIEIQKTMQRNMEVMDENRELEDSLAQLENENEDLKTRVSESHSAPKAFGSMFGLKKAKPFW